MLDDDIPVPSIGGMNSSREVLEGDSELTVEERVEKMIQEKERRAMEAWTMMPRLFDIWDNDQSGNLDKEEVFLGVEEYCDAREIVFDSRIINELWAQVDDNEDGVLDLHEFSVFLARYCDAVGVALDDMAMVVFSQLSQGMEKEEQEGEVEEKPESPWAMLASLTGRRHSKRVSWANLKVESEKIERNPPVSIWDSIKVNFIMNRVEKAKEMGDHDEKKTAVDNLWHKLDESMDFRKKRLDNALDFGGKKKVTVTDQKQKEPKKRTMSRIEASSLDGFFSSVGEVVKQNQRDRETSSSIVPSLGSMTGVGSDDGKATDASSTDFRARGSWTNLAARRDMH